MTMRRLLAIFLSLATPGNFKISSGCNAPKGISKNRYDQKKKREGILYRQSEKHKVIFYHECIMEKIELIR